MKNTFKKINYLVAVFLIALIPFSAFSQKPANKKEMGNEQRENREAAKIAYFTNKMELTVEESQNFWPIVNEMQDELKSLRAEMKYNFKRENDASEVSDKELEEMMDARMQMGIKQMEIKIKYHEKFKQILPIRKVAKYYEATKSYKRVKVENKKENIRR